MLSINKLKMYSFIKYNIFIIIENVESVLRSDLFLYLLIYDITLYNIQFLHQMYLETFF